MMLQFTTGWAMTARECCHLEYSGIGNSVVPVSAFGEDSTAQTKVVLVFREAKSHVTTVSQLGYPRLDRFGGVPGKALTSFRSGV